MHVTKHLRMPPQVFFTKERTMKKLGFGLMRLPLLDPEDKKTIDMEALCQMVDSFLDQGFTYFDTAYMYHDTQSERAIREALVNRHPRDCFLLTTKLPTMYLKEKEDMERIFNEQLEKCGVEYFDYYLVHNLNTNHYATAERLGAFEFVMNKKREGKVRKLGFSFHDSAEVLDRILTDHPEVDVVQLQINYLDWESEKVQSRLCYEVARKHGKPIIVMEPVKGGALARVPDAVTALFKNHDSGASVASWAIRFAAGLEGVIMVLSGMSDMNQLMDNTSYMKDFCPLCEEEQARVMTAAEMINGSIAIPCTACQYCTVDCPMNIAIPEYFSLYNGAKRSRDPNTDRQIADYRILAKARGKASDCIECGQCEEKCPQKIAIMERLKDVKDQFERMMRE